MKIVFYIRIVLAIASVVSFVIFIVNIDLNHNDIALGYFFLALGLAILFIAFSELETSIGAGLLIIFIGLGMCVFSVFSIVSFERINPIPTGVTELPGSGGIYEVVDSTAYCSPTSSDYSFLSVKDEPHIYRYDVCNECLRPWYLHYNKFINIEKRKKIISSNRSKRKALECFD